MTEPTPRHMQQINITLPVWMVLLIDELSAAEMPGKTRTEWVLDLLVAVVQGEMEDRHGVLRARDMLKPYHDRADQHKQTEPGN